MGIISGPDSGIYKSFGYKFNFNTRFIGYYLSKAVRKEKRETDIYNMIYVILSANIDKIDSYLASPNWEPQKYNHRTGKIKVLSNEMPSDPNDPERLNRKQSFLEQNPYSIIDINNIFLYNQYLTIP